MKEKNIAVKNFGDFKVGSQIIAFEFYSPLNYDLEVAICLYSAFLCFSCSLA